MSLKLFHKKKKKKLSFDGYNFFFSHLVCGRRSGFFTYFLLLAIFTFINVNF